MTGTTLDGAPDAGLDANMVRAAQAIRELRGKIDSLELARREPIAVVGIGCRLPGGVDSAESYWRLLSQGTDAVTEVPPSRWDVEEFFDPDPDAAGRMPMRYGAFCDGVDLFDPYFFGISPREAARMDPQQRLFLEVAWEALEDAGQTRERLQGSATGVFVGANSTDYLQLQLADPTEIDTYTIVGGTNCIIGNRLSYLFDLRGPSLTVDTACSSSLVAAHLACQSLRGQECDTAVVGGINLILSPFTTMAHAKGLPLAPDGRCKTFDARADGYCRGEGVVVVVLRRLSDAVAGNDPIWAVINGSAVNQDGLTNGLTAPNGRSQRAVITRALDNARLTPAQVTLLEAHGTGTVLGDPIEVESLLDVYGAKDGPDDACALGSVKTNIGHLEAGAGIAGLVKVVLSIRHAGIAPNLHLESVNPHINLGGSRLFVPAEPMPWERPDERRHGAVSAFGAGGTNAHMILGPAPGDPDRPDPGPDPTDLADPGASGDPETEPGPISVTAPTSDALTALVRSYRDHLRSPAGQTQRLADIAYSATARRTQHDHRCVVVAGSHDQAADRLGEWLDGATPLGVTAGRASSEVGRGVVFVFPGQGSQRPGMGRELMRTCPVFRAAVSECDQAMRGWLGRSVLGEITGADGSGGADPIDLVQPALFAIAVGLAARMRALGVEPDLVVGHSMGEVAAAHVAGALDLTDAARVICRRSRLLRRIAGRGRMLVVALPMNEAERVIDPYLDRVSVAVSNSPTSTVLSGDPAALDELRELLGARNVFCRPVKVDVASHSPQVDPLRDDLLAELAGIAPRPGTVPILSTVTGRVCDGADFDAPYWVRNLREPVLFWDAVRALVDRGSGVFVELSPHPVLLPAVEQGLERAGRTGLTLAAMRRDEPEARPSVAAVGALHAYGFEVPVGRVLAGDARPVPLPRYAWQHERFWFTADERGPVVPTRRDAPVPAPRPARTPETAPGQPDGRPDPFAGTSPGQRRAVLSALVLAEVAGALEFEPSRVDPRVGFFQMGMDSVLAARARVGIEAALGRRLPAPVMFEHPTVEALTEYLLDAATGRPGPAGTGDPHVPEPRTSAPGDRTPGPATGRVPDGPPEELSEEDLLAALAEEVGMPIDPVRGLR
ncbi:MAG TPA: type I polyketide synthase [Mycobacteriales bacterium]|nr:type I polyketide synthase [Mycobacteriales bacterium]